MRWRALHAERVSLARSLASVSILGTTLSVLAGGKALQAPDFNQTAPVFGPPVHRRMAQHNVRHQLAAYGGYNAVDWVMDAVGVYLTAAQSAEFHFEKGGQKMRTPDTPTDEGDYPGGTVPASLWGLINRPNPWFDWLDLIDYLLIDLMLVGNGYWLKYGQGPDGKPLALYRLTPAWMEIVPGERKLVDHYLYRVEGQAVPLEFQPEEVIHFKLPNPHSQVFGAGVLSGNPRVYDLELALVDTMAAFFENGTKLSGVLSTDRSMPEPLVQKVRRQFASMYAGKHKAYQVAVLERGLTFSPIQPTAAESQFVELTKMGRDRVFTNFGVHPSLVNGDSTRPGLLDEAQRFFDDKKMKPALRKLARKISAELTSAWGVDFQFDYEYVMPEKDRLTLAAVFSAIPGVKVKEVREYVGLAPLGDDRDDVVLNMPGLGVEQGGTPMGAVPGLDGGRPAKPNNLSAFPNGGGANGPGTQPDARYQRARGKLQKALESGDTKALEAVMAEVAVVAQEPGFANTANEPEQETLTDTKALGERVIEVLVRNRGLKKPDRQLALDDVKQATQTWPANSKPLRGRVIAAVSEGIRRGYSIDQIIDGHPDEGFHGVRGVLGLADAA